MGISSVMRYAGGTVSINRGKVPRVGADIRANGKDLRMNAHAKGTKPGGDDPAPQVDIKQKAMGIVQAHARGTTPLSVPRIQGHAKQPPMAPMQRHASGTTAANANPPIGKDIDAKGGPFTRHAGGTNPFAKPNDAEDLADMKKGTFSPAEERKEEGPKPGQGAKFDRFHAKKKSVKRKMPPFLVAR